ncbi:MAG: hydrogenase [Nitrososphaerota archaeon]|nr:hydrogenase [Nitrososphaerota archaeon]
MVVSPDVGIDVGISKAKGSYLVTSSDPITGTNVRIGWHAVNVSANDIATSGIMPDLLNVVALFPVKTKPEIIRKVMSEINKTANGLDITVAGGHTEITQLVDRPLVIVTAIGSGNKFMTAADAKPYDSILMTKTAGIEGTSILAKIPKVRRLLSKDLASRGSSMINQLSILKEARAASSTGRISAMHDITEGGVIGAVYEMSVASKLGFELFEKDVPVDDSTSAICSKLSINPLKLIGSGSLLIACPSSYGDYVSKQITRLGIACARIGRFLPSSKRRFLRRPNGECKITQDAIQDELWEALRKYGNLS